MKQVLIILSFMNCFCLHCQNNKLSSNIMSTDKGKATKTLDELEKERTIFTTEEEFYKDYIPVIIPEYFLLSALLITWNDKPYPNKSNEITCYTATENYLVEYLDTYITQVLGISISKKTDENKNIHIYSSELNVILSNFFEQDGRLKKSLFDSKEKIYSFLLGNYLRAGSKGNNYYSLSPTIITSQDLFSLLRDVHCIKILYSGSNPAFRSGSISCFDFQAPFLLRKYFNTVEDVKSQKPILKYTTEAWKNYVVKFENKKAEILQEAFYMYEGGIATFEGEIIDSLIIK